MLDSIRRYLNDPIVMLVVGSFGGLVAAWIMRKLWVTWSVMVTPFRRWALGRTTLEFNRDLRSMRVDIFIYAFVSQMAVILMLMSSLGLSVVWATVMVSSADRLSTVSDNPLATFGTLFWGFVIYIFAMSWVTLTSTNRWSRMVSMVSNPVTYRDVVVDKCSKLDPDFDESDLYRVPPSIKERYADKERDAA